MPVADFALSFALLSLRVGDLSCPSPFLSMPVEDFALSFALFVLAYLGICPVLQKLTAVGASPPPPNLTEAFETLAGTNAIFPN